ncbi:hypothetical protein JXM67_15390 [candidate division WOR-3 bacterium]|nr:hypothetical protein [candidate division WOR-3 bacterium]
MPVRDLPGYYPEILDGGLGVMPPSLAGLFAIVGTAEKGTLDVRFATNPDDVEDEYGFGELTHSAYDAFVSGAVQIGLIRSHPDSPAVPPITTPVRKIYGDPTDSTVRAEFAVGYVSPHTVPGSTANFRLKIVKGGAIKKTPTANVATYKLSANDGITWGPETKFIVTEEGSPNKSKIDLGNGTYIEFSEAATPADSFAAGDEYRWSTYEPRSSLDEIIEACERAAAWKDPNTGYGFEYIYVPIQSAAIWSDRSKTNIEVLWAAMDTIAEILWTDEQRPIWFVMNVPPMKDDGSEDIQDWIGLLEQCSAESRNPRRVVNAGYALMLDGRGELSVRAAGGSAAGLASKVHLDLHHSIGWVRYMRIPNMISVYPYKPIEAVADETLGTGDGTNKTFTGFMAEIPVVPWSVTITSEDEPAEEFVDGGDGILYDSTSGDEAGTIDYETGEYSVTFATAPALSKKVTADYVCITNDEMDKGNVARLNDARFLTLRQWIGYGIRFTDDWTMADPTSDYYCIRNRRIVDEAVRQVGTANVPYVNSPGITERDMAAYKADLSRPLEAMKITEDDTDKPIMDYALILTPDPNIWSNGIVNAKIEIVPTPTKKKLVATFQLRTKIEE